MYEDTDVWPIKCANCGYEFTEEIGRIEAGDEIGCPECGTDNDPCEHFSVYLSLARKGEFNPWGHMVRITPVKP
jgi:rubredoxin